MTRVRITRVSGNIVKVDCDGHTSYGAAGEDIVCAALSSIVQTAVLGLMNVVGADIKLRRNEKQGKLVFSLPDNLTEVEMHDAQVILSTMLLGVADLHEGYSDFIELEVN